MSAAINNGQPVFVLVHGAWQGNWVWEDVADRLRAAGYRVFTPSLTGLGERAHLAGPAVDLETHVSDVLGVIEHHELDNIVLCGHSYGGMVVGGAADRVPQKIGSLVYLDAFIPEAGKSLWDFLPAEGAAAQRSSAKDGWRIARISAAEFRVQSADHIMRLDRRAVDQPIATMDQKSRVTGAWRNIQHLAYIRAAGQPRATFAQFAEVVKKDPKWQYFEVPCGHNVMLDLPDALTGILLGCAVRAFASKEMTGESYRSAGVDIDAGDALVEAIKPLAKATARAGAEAGLGGFAALFDLKAAGFKDPILLSTTDGVGTKLKIAIAANRHASIGQDLVAMCVNDLVVQGAEPLFFLDYFATGKLEVDKAKEIIAGIARACQETGCALVGGETAEMPGMYAQGDYDLAGFAVGAVERGQALDGSKVAEGDIVLGMASSGLHSNGFSLVRRVVEVAKLDYAAPAPFAPNISLAEALLVPTRLYVKACRAAMKAGAHAFAHITGGGLVDNIPRVLPDPLAAEIDATRWPLPPVFRWLAETAKIARGEMARTFNCGIGMVAIVAPGSAAAARAAMEAAGERVIEIGRIVKRPAGNEGTILKGTESAWPG